MKLRKLLTYALLAALGWQYQELILRQLGLVTNAMPLIQTYVQMESFRGELGEYVRYTGRMPHNTPDWLRRNFTSRGEGDVGVDYFGTPYYGHTDRARRQAKLVSCGPDGRCFTDDDLELVFSTDLAP